MQTPGAPIPTRAVETVHERFVKGRRVRRLHALIVPELAGAASLLDIGCGDGKLARAVAESCPGLSVEGVDVLARPDASIPVRAFDGVTLPYPDQSFDAAMLIDVLHHTDDPQVLLREAARAARDRVIVKDHMLQGLLAGSTLRFMDAVGNRRHGVALPHNYLDDPTWRRMLDAVGLRVEAEHRRLGLYPFPFGLMFDRKLHVLFRLRPTASTA